VSKQLLHESREPQLEGASSLIRDEQRNTERDLRGRRADNLANLPSFFHFEFGRAHIRNRAALLVDDRHVHGTRARLGRGRHVGRIRNAGDRTQRSNKGG
jgi:hypothetical protein